MADDQMKSTNVNPYLEKQGNTTWVSCRTCRGWFHVSDALLMKKGVHLFCPLCRDQFPKEEAEKIVHP
jgi:hypothetical protein